MNIEQVGAELLEVLKQGLVSGSEIIKGQFPILYKQVLRWGIINNSFTILLSLIVMIAIYKLTVFGIAKQKACEYDGDIWLLLNIPCIITGIIFFIIFWCSIFELGKIFSSPNVYLLDYFKALIQPKQ